MATLGKIGEKKPLALYTFIYRPEQRPLRGAIFALISFFAKIERSNPSITDRVHRNENFVEINKNFIV